MRTLVDRITDAQVREIAEMKRMVARLEATPVPANALDLPSYRDRNVPSPSPETAASAGVETLTTDR